MGPLGPPLESLLGPYLDAQLRRPVKLPENASIIGLGSAVLGGAGKTPVAVAYAKALRKKGESVAVVCHAYQARPRRNRQVHPTDAVELVGDDALVLATALQESDIGVWVGPNRAELFEHLAVHVKHIVVDGLLQTRPRPLSRSVLVLDGQHPWGSGHALPMGDLRASPARLLDACDELLVVHDPLLGLSNEAQQVCRACSGRTIRLASLEPHQAVDARGHRLGLDELRAMRLGLCLTVAHPERIQASLRVRGIREACAWFGADHKAPGPGQLAEIGALAREHRLQGWLVTPKCSPHLQGLELGAQSLRLVVRTQLDL